MDNSIPIDLLTEVYVRGTALTPDQYHFESVMDELKERGLALPRRTTGYLTLVLFYNDDHSICFGRVREEGLSNHFFVTL